MHPNEKLLSDFYQAFKDGKSDIMMGSYHEKATFSDPVFLILNSLEVQSMWEMLISRGKGDVEISYSGISADETSGKAYWEAKYKFSKTDRPVHNKIHASFTFKDGKILAHKDDFNFKSWAGMALGLIGKIFGGTSWLQSKVQKQAMDNLKHYMQ